MFLESKASIKNVKFKMAHLIWRLAERETILSRSLPNPGITEVYSHFIFLLLFFIFLIFLCFYVFLYFYNFCNICNFVARFSFLFYVFFTKRILKNSCMYKDFVLHQVHFITITLSKHRNFHNFWNSDLQDYQNEVASFLNIHFCTNI